MPHSLSKDLFITLLLAVVACVVIAMAGWNMFEKPEPTSNVGAELRELENRTVLGYTEFGDSTRVRYSYVGERIPEKLIENEVVEKRTPTSWTQLIGYEHKGTPQEQAVLTTRVFPQDTFVERPDGWHYVEYGEVSRKAMERHGQENPVQALFWNVAHAATTVYAGAGDGYISDSDLVNSCSAGGWDGVHDAASGNATTDSTGVISRAGNSSNDGKVAQCNIQRAFLPFVTSSIPAGASISAATLNLYITSTEDDDNDGTDYITVVQTSQATHTTLGNSDYDQCGSVNSPTEGIDSGQRKDITSISATAYLTITLNATGISWIKKSGVASTCSATAGITCMGIREGHDATDALPAENTLTSIDFSNSEETGTSQDPYLSITYTTSSFAFWQFQDF